MSESTELTTEEAREIVIQIAQKKGWVSPRLREKTDPETLELLRIIESIQEELGDAVETYELLIWSSGIIILAYSSLLESLVIYILTRPGLF
jgi:hypothetical protein